MTTVQISFGSKRVEIDLEGVLLDSPERRSGDQVQREVILQALQKPLGTQRLREIVNAKKEAEIVIVVDDHTRDAPTEMMLDALTREIGAQQSERITLLVACGSHTAPTDDDLKRLLGNYRSRFNVQVHDCDAKDLVFLGTTTRGTPVSLNRTYVDSDIKILTGDITLHYYAGFGGGRKSILPGISSRETIKRNHALLIDDRARIANLWDNPVHLDMNEAASLAAPDFVMNTVADSKGYVLNAYAGDMNTVFLKGAEQARELLLRETEQLFDAVIVSAGGFPQDRNLYQASKAIENCYNIIKPGGLLILVAECREGVGDQYFEEWMDTYTTYEDAESAIKTNFILGGHKAFYIRRAMSRFRLSIVSNLNPNTLNGWGIPAYKSVSEAVKEEININDKIKVGIVKSGKDTLFVPRAKIER